MTKEAVDTRLSYSSATSQKNCEMKWYYYKVKEIAKDKDSQQNDSAFNVGKCFHYVMEENNHTEDKLEDLLDKGCKAYEVESDKAMIHAMLLRYLQVHQNSGLVSVKNELMMSNEIMIGYIDSMMVDEDGGWWLVDLKTAARFSDIKASMLHNDYQLNLYAYFYKEIAEMLELDPKKFKGCRYRVTTKYKLKQKSTESYREFVLRLANGIKSYDIIIPIDKMNPGEIYKEHKRLHKKSLALRKGTVKPSKNLSYCDSFFRPCEYFSQCHGSTYTESLSEVEMIKSKNA